MTETAPRSDQGMTLVERLRRLADGTAPARLNRQEGAVLIAVVEAAQEVKRLGEGNVPSEELIAAVDVMYEKLDLLHSQASGEGKVAGPRKHRANGEAVGTPGATPLGPAAPDPPPSDLGSDLANEPLGAESKRITGQASDEGKG